MFLPEELSCVTFLYLRILNNIETSAFLSLLLTGILPPRPWEFCQRRRPDPVSSPPLLVPLVVPAPPVHLHVRPHLQEGDRVQRASDRGIDWNIKKCVEG